VYDAAASNTPCRPTAPERKKVCGGGSKQRLSNTILAHKSEAIEMVRVVVGIFIVMATEDVHRNARILGNDSAIRKCEVAKGLASERHCKSFWRSIFVMLGGGTDLQRVMKFIL